MRDCVLTENYSIYLADARDLINSDRRAEFAADLVVSDPPYLLESGGNTTGEMKGKFAVGTYDNSGSIIPCDIGWDEILDLFSAVLARGHCYVMCNNKHVQACLNAASASGFRFHNLLVWDKGTCTPNRWYMKNCEFVGFFFKGKAKTINDPASQQILKCSAPKDWIHETEKPVALLEHYIRNSSKPDEVVIDPFMGSGSTGEAALRAGRKFIGIERDPTYYYRAAARLEKIERVQDLFGS